LRLTITIVICQITTRRGEKARLELVTSDNAMIGTGVVHF
jgi:hypothetical protein